jgi:uncharacterized protein YcnI
MVGGLVAATAVVVLAGPAAAHVTVNPSEAAQGGFEKLTFRVPNERDDSGTTAVEVNMPADAVLQYVSVQPVAGWTADVAMRPLDEPVEAEGGTVTEVVDKITWTGGTINPGEFEEFSISAGVLPDDVDKLEFPAIQTYASGEEVRWIEEVAEGGDEPEHPVPTLYLTAATGDGHGGGGDAEEASTGGATGEDAAAAASSDSDDGSSNALSIVALVVGGLGVILGGLALIRGRSAAAS